MRKTVLLWDCQSLILKQSQLKKLRSLQNLYSSELLLTKLQTEESESNMIKLGNTYDYILLTSSNINPKKLSQSLTNKCNSAIVNNLTGVIVYCFELNRQKITRLQQFIIQIINNVKIALEGNLVNKNRQQIPQIKPVRDFIKVTNQISKVISYSLNFLGYQLSFQEEAKLADKPQIQKVQKQQNKIQFTQIQQTETTRFVLHRRTNNDSLNNSQQQFSNPQLYLMRGHRIILNMFQLPFNVEKQPIQVIKKTLHKQLTEFIQAKSHPEKSPAIMLQKQFKKIHEARNLEQLAQACIYFYTLEKPALYYNLNMILKNLRYIKFKQQFQKIKTFAFLLLLNYFFVYDGDHYLGNELLYRYTNYIPLGTSNDMQVGDVVSVSTFYSVSSSQNHFIKQNKQTQQKNKLSKSANIRKTKIVIHAISQSQSFKDNLCLRSRYPAHLFSAFPKQMEFLYAPFTRFKVLSIVNPQLHINQSEQFGYVIHLQQLPYNIFLSKIIDINIGLDLETSSSFGLQNKNQGDSKYSAKHQNSSSKREWELSYQLKYQKYASQFKKYIRPFYLPQNVIKTLNSKTKQKVQIMVLQMKDKILRKVFNNLGILSFQSAIQNDREQNSSYKVALSYLQKALQIALKQKQNQRIVATNYNNIAMVYYKKGQLQKSHQFYIKAKQVIQSLERDKTNNKLQLADIEKIKSANIAFIANIYNNLGSISQELKKYQEALLLYSKALSLVRNSSNQQQQTSIDKFLQANILNNIAYCKSSSGQSKQAIKIFLEARAAFNFLYGAQKLGKSHSCSENVMVEQNISRCYSDLKQFQQAILHLNLAIDLEKVLLGCPPFNPDQDSQKKQKYRSTSGNIYDGPASGVLLNLFMTAAKIYNNNLQNYDMALLYYQNALNISIKINGKYHRTTAIIYSNIGSAMQSTAETDQQLQLALGYYDSSLQSLSKPIKPQNQDIFDYVIDMRSLLAETMEKLKKK